MILDMRYHIVSLVAVFLALGIGILIGTSLMGGGAVVEQQQKIIDRLQADFENLRDETKKLEGEKAILESELRVMDQFARSVEPVLIKDRLFGKQIALIRTGDAVDGRVIEELRLDLEKAGGNVVSVTTFLRPPENTDMGTAMAEALGLKATPQVVEGMWTALAAQLTKGTPFRNLSRLVQSELLQLSGDYRTPVDAVIIIGGSKEDTGEWKTIDLPLIEAIKKVGIPIAAVETVDAPVSYIRYYRQQGILTVDNIDTVPGKVALIYGLATGKRSSFGVKDSAKQLLPSLEVAVP